MGNYAGLALPWDGTLKTFVAEKTDNEVLTSSVLWILMTRLGERVMLPEFGSDIPNQLFEPNDDITVDIIRTAVREAVERWDGRIEFHQVDISQNEHLISVRVEYKNAEDPYADQYSVLEFSVRPELL